MNFKIHTKATDYEIISISALIAWATVVVLSVGVLETIDKDTEGLDFALALARNAIGIAGLILVPYIALRFCLDNSPAFKEFYEKVHKEYEEGRKQTHRELDPEEIRTYARYRRKCAVVWILSLVAPVIYMAFINAYVPDTETSLANCILIMLIPIPIMELLMFCSVAYSIEADDMVRIRPKTNSKGKVPEAEREKVRLIILAEYVAVWVLVSVIAGVLLSICYGTDATISQDPSLFTVAILMGACIGAVIWAVWSSRTIDRHRVKETDDPTLAFGEYLFDDKRD